MDRRDLIRNYKETPRPAGVYRVRNNVNGRSVVGASRNLPGLLNRQRFQLKHGAHPDRVLQKDWNELGSEAFTFEILDQLEPSTEAGYDPAEDLDLLMRMWLEKLEAAGEALYRQSKTIV